MAKGVYQKWLRPENLDLIRGWKRIGLTDEQIAKNIGINVSTFYDWQNKYPEIYEAVQKGKDHAVIEVENALFKAAIGYTVEEISEEVTGKPDPARPGQMIPASVKRKTTPKYYPPNVLAAITILNNWAPDRYRNRKPVDDRQPEEADIILIDDLKEMDDGADKN